MHNGALMKSVRISVSLPKDQHQQVQDLAEINSLSVAWLVRQAVSEFLDRNNKPQEFNPLNPLVKDNTQGKS